MQNLFGLRQNCFSVLVLLFIFTVPTSLFSQNVLKGNVFDSDTRDPLIGATISVENTTVGTSADVDGNFTLELPSGADRVEVRFVGYKKQSLYVGDKTFIKVGLRSEAYLDEVILIGYSRQKKSDKTGAVAHVTSEELNKGRLSDPIQAMQGKAAGVNVSKQGGDPNAGFSVNIRGAAGLTSGTGPLYVVDGVPGVDPTSLNPDDIESINVLKDASSAAIYGSRGANGVVIITTKGASLAANEQSMVEYSGFVSFDNVANRLDLLTASEVRDFAQETGATFIDNGADVDWQDEIYRTGVSRSHSLAFSGGTSSSNYRASLSAMNVEGVMKGSAKDRYIGRLNLSQRTLNDKLTLQGRISGTIERNDYVNYGNGAAPNNAIYQAIRRSPTDPVTNPDGSFFETDRSFQYHNPVAIIEDIQNERDAKRFLGNFRADLEVIENLNVAVNMAYIRDDGENFYFEPSFTASNTTNGFGRREYNNKESSLIETTINWRKTLKEAHNLNLIGGHSYQRDIFDGFSAQGEDAQSDFVNSNNLNSLLLLEPGSISSYKNESLLASFFGRAVYDYNKKYFFTATIRRDGSSKFGANNEWGWFPSFSAAWDLSKEKFISDESIISQLKLRVGYGVTGNQEIPIGIDRSFFVPGGTAINPETGETVIAFVNDGDVNPNPDLKWEENKELNFGLDFGIWKDRVSGSIEYYNKTTSDLIYRYELPVPPNRNRYIYANAGEIENRGIEVAVQGMVFTKKKWNWKSVLTFTRNQQETVSLSNELYDVDMIRTLFVSGRGLVGGENWTQLIAPGFEIGTFYMPEFEGFSEDGQFLFATAAGGVTRDVTLAERRVVGQAQPDFILGFSEYFKIGENLDLSFAGRWVKGHDILNVTRMVFGNPAELPTLNTLATALDEYNNGFAGDIIISDYYLEDASFLRLDFVTLGYSIDPGWQNMKNIRLNVSATNLLTLTDYTGTDPEVSYGGLEFGREQYDVYPKTRSLTVGVSAQF